MKSGYRNASENMECSWLNSKMEELFSEALPSEERQRADRHIAQCDSCRGEFESLRAIDPMIKNVLRYRAALAAAPAPRRIHFGRAFGAAAALAAATALAIALWNPAPPETTGSSIANNPGNVIEKPVDPKDVVTPERDLGKPGDKPEGAEPSVTAPNENVDPRTKAGVEGPAPKFAVIDMVGREWTLADYRGQIVLIGVLSPKQPQAAANLERLYQTYGARLRLLAVKDGRKEPAPKDTTFKVFSNNGSDLLGAHAGEYALVDRAGTVVSRGSLIGDGATIVNTVGAAIKPLETR